jgi:hypothetical protein
MPGSCRASQAALPRLALSSPCELGLCNVRRSTALRAIPSDKHLVSRIPRLSAGGETRTLCLNQSKHRTDITLDPHLASRRLARRGP